MMLDEVMKNNANFVKEFEPKKMSHIPQKKLAIVTCMDTRLTGFLEPAMGIGRGDAKIIKNAGNAAVDRDVIRSVAAAIYALGAEEVMVVGHYDCGMANVDQEKLENTMKERGVDEKLLSDIDLKDWIGAIDGEEENVVEVVEKIKESPFIPEDVPIHGLIIDLYEGKIKVLVEGNITQLH
ncbi:carbonic anhydrase [Methanobacterium sp. SMA-27]|uniref:beta-class carbonic anhydrase n=1 Tax=Methanobacterium sp. SMA-27 TaxID=1495336 RepID=UPI0006500446|nr:carbonic anhydrase [Methanobacterium sp. SMA-27]